MKIRKTLIIEGSQEELEIILALFESGELPESAGIKILDVEMISADMVEAERATSIAHQSLIESASEEFSLYKIWLDILWEKGYQPAVRSTQDATGIKLIQFQDKSVELLIKIVQLTEAEIQIYLQVRPSAGKGYLPDKLKVSVFDDLGEIIPEKSARNQTNLLDITQGGNLICKPQDSFSVRLTLENETVIEDFARA